MSDVQDLQDLYALYDMHETAKEELRWHKKRGDERRLQAKLRNEPLVFNEQEYETILKQLTTYMEDSLYTFRTVLPVLVHNGLTLDTAEKVQQASTLLFRTEIDALVAVVKWFKNVKVHRTLEKKQVNLLQSFLDAMCDRIEERIGAYTRVIKALTGTYAYNEYVETRTEFDNTHTNKKPTCPPLPRSQLLPPTQDNQPRPALKLTPSTYSYNGQTRQLTGDFSTMITQPAHTRSYFIFNDNEGDFYNQSTHAGAGNGAMRQFQTCKNPVFRTSGIPTGHIGGYPSIGDSKTKGAIDKGIETIKSRIDREYINNVYYSADSEGNLGSGTFDPSAEVKAYILHKLYAELGTLLPQQQQEEEQQKETEDGGEPRQQQQGEQQEEQQQRHEEHRQEQQEEEEKGDVRPTRDGEGAAAVVAEDEDEEVREGDAAAAGDGGKRYGYLVAFVLVCISVYVLLYEWTGEGNTGLLMGVMVVLTAAIGFVYMFILRRHIFPNPSPCGADEGLKIEPEVPLPKFARDHEEGDAFTNSNWYEAHTRTTPLSQTEYQQPKRTL